VFDGTDSTETYGGASDTWNHSWSAGELADGTFRIKVEGKAGGATPRISRLDYLRIKVYYTEAAADGETKKLGQFSIFTLQLKKK